VGFDGNVTKNLLRDHVNSATLVKNNSSHNYQWFRIPKQW